MSDTQREEIAKLEALYAAHPEGRVFTHLAEAYRKAGELSRARDILGDGLRRHPDYSSAHVVLGRVLTDEGDTTAAAAAFRRVLELDRHNLVALRALGEIADRNGDPTAALGYYRDLQALDPSDDGIRAAVRRLEAGESDAGVAAAAAPEGDVAAAEPAGVHFEPPPDAGAQAGAGWLEDMADAEAEMPAEEAGDIPPLAGLETFGEEPAAEEDAGQIDTTLAGLEFGTGFEEEREEAEEGVTLGELEWPTGDEEGIERVADEEPIADLEAWSFPADTGDTEEDEAFEGDFSTTLSLSDDDAGSDHAGAAAAGSADDAPPEWVVVDRPAGELEQDAAGHAERGGDLETFADLPIEAADMEFPGGADEATADAVGSRPFGMGSEAELADAERADAVEREAETAESWAEEMPGSGAGDSEAEAASAKERAEATGAEEHAEPTATAEQMEEGEEDAAFQVSRYAASFLRPAEEQDVGVVTATMADLYARQGFFDRAIQVYRQLLDGVPDDERLRERLKEVEAMRAAAAAPGPPVIGGRGAAGDAADADEAPWIAGASGVASAEDTPYAWADAASPDDGGGKSVGEYFAGLLSWRPARVDVSPPAEAAGDEASILELAEPMEEGAEPVILEAGAMEAAIEEWFGGEAEPQSAGGEPGETRTADGEGDADLEMFRSWLQSLKK